jgi:seryl-tRNA synthetase
VATGDLGASASRKFDCEAWIPTQGRYRELTSTSNCTDFQARRLNIRYRHEQGQNVVAHSLNNTVAASPRILIPIVELYQNADGSITVPAVLRPYMGGWERIALR